MKAQMKGCRKKYAAKIARARRQRYEQRSDEILARQKVARDRDKDRINAERREARAENPEKFRRQQREYLAANNERVNETRRKRWVAKRDYLIAQARDYHTANPEKVRTWARTNRERNGDKIKARQADYYRRNPEVYAMHRARRRARLAEVEHEDYTRTEIFDRDGGRCRECDKELVNEPNGFQIDHIVPISLGGPDTRANVQLMCQPCNREKWANLEGQIHLPV